MLCRRRSTLVLTRTGILLWLMSWLIEPLVKYSCCYYYYHYSIKLNNWSSHGPGDATQLHCLSTGCEYLVCRCIRWPLYCLSTLGIWTEVRTQGLMFPSRDAAKLSEVFGVSDGPLEKWWVGWDVLSLHDFFFCPSLVQEFFFFMAYPLQDFFLPEIRIVNTLPSCQLHEYFPAILPWTNFFWVFPTPSQPPCHFSNGPSLTMHKLTTQMLQIVRT